MWQLKPFVTNFTIKYHYYYPSLCLLGYKRQGRMSNYFDEAVVRVGIVQERIRLS